MVYFKRRHPLHKQRRPIGEYKTALIFVTVKLWKTAPHFRRPLRPLDTYLRGEAEILRHAVLPSQLDLVIVPQRDVAYIADSAYVDRVLKMHQGQLGDATRQHGFP